MSETARRTGTEAPIAAPIAAAIAPVDVTNRSLRCVIEDRDAMALVHLSGHLTVDTIRALADQLSLLIRSGRRHITLDMRDLVEVSPVAVGVLNRSIGELRNVAGSLSLRSVREPVATLLRKTGLHPAVRTSPHHLDVA